jgi:hypothetical protein
VFIAITAAASHDVALAVLRILATTVAFPARVDAVALPFALQVGEGVVGSPEDAMTFSFSFALPTSAFLQLDSAPKASSWLSREASPGSFRSSIHPVDVLGGFLLGHMGDLGQLNVFGPIVR